MTNHVHLVLVPSSVAGLHRVMGCLAWGYAQAINRLHCRSGHLWQGRHFSCPLDEGHLDSAMRYVKRNPVRAAMVPHAEQSPWSSAAAHCIGRDDRGLVDAAAWASRHPPPLWRQVLREREDERHLDGLRFATRTGRPLACDSFIAKLETRLGRHLRPHPRGRPRRIATADAPAKPGTSRAMGGGGDSWCVAVLLFSPAFQWVAVPLFPEGRKVHLTCML